MQIEERRNPCQIQADQSQINLAKEQKIRSVLGYPVTRRIVNGEERIILDVGDLITSKAVIQARQAGVLDLLLNSVYISPTQNNRTSRLRQRGLK